MEPQGWEREYLRKAKFRTETSSPKLSSDLIGEDEIAAHWMAEKFDGLPGPDLLHSCWASKEATFWGIGLPQSVSLTYRENLPGTGRAQVSLG